MVCDCRPINIGAWLSLVERPVRDREVAGSNPVAPILESEKRKLLVFLRENNEKRKQKKRDRHRACTGVRLSSSVYGTNVRERTRADASVSMRFSWSWKRGGTNVRERTRAKASVSMRFSWPRKSGTANVREQRFDKRKMRRNLRRKCLVLYSWVSTND